MLRQTRAPKLIGDFGEGLVTYALIRKGFEVACVDHVGADLIAEKSGNRFAISVKTRLFREGSKESLVFVVEKSHLEKLENFAEQFGMLPIYALTVCLADKRIIQLIMMRVSDLKETLPEVKHGYSLRLSEKSLSELLKNPKFDYSCWKDETIGQYDFADRVS